MNSKCARLEAVRDLNARPYVYFAHSYYVPENRRATRRPAPTSCTYTAVLEIRQCVRRAVPSREIGRRGLWRNRERNFVELAC